MIGQLLGAASPAAIEWELDPGTLARTSRWRRRQFYALPGVLADRRPPSERTACEWRVTRAS